MERYGAIESVLRAEIVELEQALADAQATVEALQKKYDDLLGKYHQLVDFYDKHNGTPCEQIRHEQQVEELQRERGEARHTADVYQKLYGTAVMDRAIAHNEKADLQAALDAERDWLALDLKKRIWLLHGSRMNHLLYGDDGRMDCNVCLREYAGATLEQCYEWEIADACALVAKAALTPAGGGQDE